MRVGEGRRGEHYAQQGGHRKGRKGGRRRKSAKQRQARTGKRARAPASAPAAAAAAPLSSAAAECRERRLHLLLRCAAAAAAQPVVQPRAGLSSPPPPHAPAARHDRSRAAGGCLRCAYAAGRLRKPPRAALILGRCSLGGPSARPPAPSPPTANHPANVSSPMPHPSPLLLLCSSADPFGDGFGDEEAAGHQEGHIHIRCGGQTT